MFFDNKQRGLPDRISRLIIALKTTVISITDSLSVIGHETYKQKIYFKIYFKVIFLMRSWKHVTLTSGTTGQSLLGACLVVPCQCIISKPTSSRIRAIDVFIKNIEAGLK